MAQYVDLPIVGGEDQNEDERIGDGLQRLQNALYRRRGGIAPRLGQQKLTPTQPNLGYYPTTNKSDALVVCDDQLALVKGGVVRPYAPSVGSDGRLGAAGPASVYYVERDSLEASATSQSSMQVARGAGMLCVVWTQNLTSTTSSVAVMAKLVDEETGATLMPPVQLDSGNASPARVCFMDGRFWVFYIASSPVAGDGLIGVEIDPVTQTAGTPTLLFIIVPITNYIGIYALTHPNDQYCVITFATGGPDTAEYLVTVDNTLNVRGILALNTPINRQANCFGMSCLSASRCWVSIGYNQLGATPTPQEVRVALVDLTNPVAPVQTVAPTIWRTDSATSGAAPNRRFIYATSIVEVSSTEAFVAATFLETGSATQAAPTTFIQGVDTSIVTTGPAFQAAGCLLQSDLWTNSAGYVFAATSLSYNESGPAVGIIPQLGCMNIVCAEKASSSPYAATIDPPVQVHATFGVGVTPTYSQFLSDTFAVGSMGTLEPRKNGSQSSVVTMPDGSKAFVCYALESGQSPARAYLAKAFEVTGRQSVEMNGRALISGGAPTLWDGKSAVEWGFITTPSMSVANGGAGAIAAGSYLYAVAFEWVDANGGVMRSQVGRASITLGGASQVTMSARCSQLSHKPDGAGFLGSDRSAAYVVFYRTVAGSTGPLYRLTAIEVPFANLTRYGQLTLSVTDNYPDTGGALGALTTFPQLYTSGGVLEADPVPSARFTCTWQQRFVLAGTDDDSIWVSTENEQGEVPYFSIALRIAPFQGGRVTGIAELDDKLIIFKESRIFVAVGVLPDKTGQNGSLPVPQAISSDTGCTDPYSIVGIPAGIIFRSARGLYLVDRGLNVSFLGERVAQDVEAAAVIRAPVVVPSQNHVRFDAPTTVGGTGPVLVYDYLQDSWSRFLLDQQTVSAGRVPVSQAVSNGRVYWLDADGALWRERVNDYADTTGQSITYTVTTAWFKPMGLSGYFAACAVHILGAYGGPHVLTVRVYADFDTTTPVCTSTWNVTAAPAAGYEWKASVASARTSRMQAIAVEVTISDLGSSSTTGPSAPATISGIGLEFDPIEGPQRRIPAAQKG